MMQPLLGAQRRWLNCLGHGIPASKAAAFSTRWLSTPTNIHDDDVEVEEEGEASGPADVSMRLFGMPTSSHDNDGSRKVSRSTASLKSWLNMLGDSHDEDGDVKLPKGMRNMLFLDPQKKKVFLKNVPKHTLGKFRKMTDVVQRISTLKRCGLLENDFMPAWYEAAIRFPPDGTDKDVLNTTLKNLSRPEDRLADRVKFMFEQKHGYPLLSVQLSDGTLYEERLHRAWYVTHTRLNNLRMGYGDEDDDEYDGDHIQDGDYAALLPKSRNPKPIDAVGQDILRLSREFSSRKTSLLSHISLSFQFVTARQSFDMAELLIEHDFREARALMMIMLRQYHDPTNKYSFLAFGQNPDKVPFTNPRQLKDMYGNLFTRMETNAKVGDPPNPYDSSIENRQIDVEMFNRETNNSQLDFDDDDDGDDYHSGRGRGYNS